MKLHKLQEKNQGKFEYRSASNNQQALQGKQMSFKDRTMKGSARSAQSLLTFMASLAICVYGQLMQHHHMNI